MIAVERVQETVYVFRLSEQALDEAIADPGALVAQLEAARGHLQKPVASNGHGGFDKSAVEKLVARHTKRPAKKPGGVQAEKRRKPGRKPKAAKAAKPRLQCPHCERTFSSDGFRQWHVRIMHTATTESE